MNFESDRRRDCGLPKAWHNQAGLRQGVVRLGRGYDQSGRTDDAAAAFAQARKLKPELFK